MIKVAREIDVLKLVKHPNIVRLYDVIETEKYFGIGLVFASGKLTPPPPPPLLSNKSAAYLFLSVPFRRRTV
jgi:serine/threonine protein kinase